MPAPASPSALTRRVAGVRRFNRFYTRRIGVLRAGHLDSPFSLTEVRVLYELAHRDEPTAAEIGRELGLDPGYLSRILRGFRKRKLLTTHAAPGDRRRSLLALTDEGKAMFGQLDERSSAEIETMLRKLSAKRQRRLLDAMDSVEQLLGDSLATVPSSREPYLLRAPEAGDLGWVVHRHGVLYAQEYGWDERFEALVAGVVADFVRNFDPRRERCWLAEREGDVVGSVFVVRQSDEVAKLRLLLVEPSARGLGIGSRLVSECMRFARQAGYRTLTLWTNDVLHSARKIYEAAGFRLVKSEPHDSFGHGLVGQTWELTL
jgi:DNA-binding MarR family transcriptional regulator/GNAT superfamily N-acetyltransferase